MADGMEELEEGTEYFAMLACGKDVVVTLLNSQQL